MERLSWFDSLSDSDRTALRLIYHRRMQVAEVAREMGVGLEGARSRFARIRSKTGLTVQAAARAFCEAEAPKARPSEAHPPLVHPSLGRDQVGAADHPSDAVREDRAVFEAHPSVAAAPLVTFRERRNPLSSLPRSVLIAIVAVLYGMVVLQTLTLLRPAQEAGLAAKHQR